MTEKQLHGVSLLFTDGTVNQLKNALVISMDDDGVEFECLNINPVDQLILTAIMLNGLVEEYFVEGDKDFDKFSMLLTSFIKELMKHRKEKQTKGAILQ